MHEKMGVIKNIEEPTDWVSSLVIVLKKHGALRICLDPRDLNKAIKREHFRLPTQQEIISQFDTQNVSVSLMLCQDSGK